MPEQIQNRMVFSLLEVSRGLQKALSDKFNAAYWIKAEMNKLNHYPHSGHCYPELLEKKDGQVVAQMRSTLWKYDFYRLNNQFKAVLKEPLRDGIKILFQAKINYDPVYGLSLNIVDIDPTWSLGDLEREKADCIARLKKEGLYDQNKMLPSPSLPQRIAIISVESSKGYADFTKVIDENEWGYAFFHLLFPSLLQGDKAVDSICAQLKQIEKVKDHFDIVAIIRGGGDEVGLSCYNDYRLAKAIAEFPLPVFTGIGHATNETVAEMVAHQNAITPTKIAQFLLQQFHNLAVPLQEAESFLLRFVSELLEREKEAIHNFAKLFRSSGRNALWKHRSEIRQSVLSLGAQSRWLLQEQKHRQQQLLQRMLSSTKELNEKAQQEQLQYQMLLERAGMQLIKLRKADLLSIEKNIGNMSPEQVLKRGYSITLHKGKLLRSANAVQTGDIILSKLAEGEIISTVKKTEDGEEQR